MLLVPQRSLAQGCILTRDEAPVIGAQVGPYLPRGGWQLNASVSQFNTNNEFMGTALREDLLDSNTEVIEGSTVLDLEAIYGITRQLSLTVDAPVTLNYHWSTVLAGTRYEDTSRGLNDMTLSGRYWVFGTANHPRENIAFDLGVRLPTGNANSQWPFPNALGEDVQNRAVFTGAQMGSGAWGIQLGMDGFKQYSEFAIFGTGNYLFSLRGENHTYSLPAATNPKGPTAVPSNEEYNSAPDSYLVHVGVAVPLHIPFLPALSGLFAGRVQGVPVGNVFGPTVGFRQPGLLFTVEPGLNYDTRLATYSVSIPIRAAQDAESSLGYARNSDFTKTMLLVSVSFNLGGGHKASGQGSAN